MRGVILCGGQSSRMGTDKGLIKQNKIEWAKTAYEKLSVLNIKSVLSINPQQAATYQRIFQPSLLISDTDNIRVKGPLLGVLTVHLRYPSEDLLVLACDMPLMDITILQQLLDCHDMDASYEAYLFTKAAEPEPLCGIYSCAGLSMIITMYKEGQLSKHSMKFIIEHLQTLFIPLRAVQEKFFTNINATEDLSGL